MLPNILEGQERGGRGAFWEKKKKKNPLLHTFFNRDVLEKGKHPYFHKNLSLVNT
jgi:hypothetical protein